MNRSDPMYANAGNREQRAEWDNESSMRSAVQHSNKSERENESTHGVMRANQSEKRAMRIRRERAMMHEAGDNYFLELLRGLAFADGAALPRFGLATLALPFLRLTSMGSDSSSDSDPVRSLGEGGSARAELAASLRGETRVGAEVDS